MNLHEAIRAACEREAAEEGLSLQDWLYDGGRLVSLTLELNREECEALVDALDDDELDAGEPISFDAYMRPSMRAMGWGEEEIDAWLAAVRQRMPGGASSQVDTC